VSPLNPTQGAGGCWRLAQGEFFSNVAHKRSFMLLKSREDYGLMNLHVLGQRYGLCPVNDIMSSTFYYYQQEASLHFELSYSHNISVDILGDLALSNVICSFIFKFPFPSFTRSPLIFNSTVKMIERSVLKTKPAGLTC